MLIEPHCCHVTGEAFSPGGRTPSCYGSKDMASLMAPVGRPSASVLSHGVGPACLAGCSPSEGRDSWRFGAQRGLLQAWLEAQPSRLRAGSQEVMSIPHREGSGEGCQLREACLWVPDTFHSPHPGKIGSYSQLCPCPWPRAGAEGSPQLRVGGDGGTCLCEHSGSFSM